MFPLPEIKDLDKNEFKISLDEIVRRIKDDNPNLDVDSGVIFSIVAYYHAALHTALKTLIEKYIKLRSLRQLTNEKNSLLPKESLEEEFVDDVLSNYLVDRREAQLATGVVSIVVNRKVPVVVTAGSLLESSGRLFSVAQTVIATDSLEDEDNPNSPNNQNVVLLQPYDQNKWFFNIVVYATKAGSEYSLRKDTELTVQFPLPGFVKAFAFQDFTLGYTKESLSELIDKLKTGISAQALSGRAHMQSLLRSKFPYVVNDSIIGYGDKEMLRDRHFLLPVSHGGKADWYIRTDEQVWTKPLKIKSTLIEKLPNNKTLWQFSIDRSKAPGFYEVVRVYPVNNLAYTGSFTITDDIRSLDLTVSNEHSFIPDIVDNIEGVFSPFQTSTIKFIDDRESMYSLPIGHEQEYNVEIRYLPYLAEIQSYVSSRQVRHFGADCLVKAPIPVFVRVEFSLHKKPEIFIDDDIISSIKISLCKEINRIPFIGRLYASKLHDVIGDHLKTLNGKVYISNMDVLGKVLVPNGERIYLRNNDVIEVPNLPHLMVSKNTAQFFIQEKDIHINIVNMLEDPS